MNLFSPTADVSVRPAVADDEAAIARVQVRAWRADHAEVLGADVLEQLDVAAVRDRWEQAITAPPSPRHHVLVACDGPRVVGFVASAPTDEDGVEVVALEVDPDHRRGGHGSRLLAACVDVVRTDGATHLSTWVLTGSDQRARFLSGAGLGPDGVTRELGVAAAGPDGLTHEVVEHRWVAEL